MSTETAQVPESVQEYWARTDIVYSTRLNAQEQRELQGRIERKQMKEFMTVSLSLLRALPLCTSGHSILSSLLGFAHHLELDVFKAGPEML